MADNIDFVNGLIVKAPHERAPDFVKAAISIKVADLKAWLDGQSGEWVNIDVKESKNGKWYAAVWTHQKKEEEKPSRPQENNRNAQGGSRSLGDMDDDIPFAPINKRIV